MKKSILEKFDTNSLINLYNAYQNDPTNNGDDIYTPNDFEEELNNLEQNLLEILDKAYYGDYNANAYAYGFDRLENIKSYDTEQDVRNTILGDDDFVKVAQDYLD